MRCEQDREDRRKQIKLLSAFLCLSFARLKRCANNHKNFLFAAIWMILRIGAVKVNDNKQRRSTRFVCAIVCKTNACHIQKTKTGPKTRIQFVSFLLHQIFHNCARSCSFPFFYRSSFAIGKRTEVNRKGKVSHNNLSRKWRTAFARNEKNAKNKYWIIIILSSFAFATSVVSCFFAAWYIFNLVRPRQYQQQYLITSSSTTKTTAKKRSESIKIRVLGIRELASNENWM